MWERFVRLIFSFLSRCTVTAAMHEPVPGWVDNLNGPTGIFVAAGKGVLRTMLCDIKNKAETIPVDKAINTIIAISHKVATGNK